MATRSLRVLLILPFFMIGWADVPTEPSAMRFISSLDAPPPVPDDYPAPVNPDDAPPPGNPDDAPAPNPDDAPLPI
ncbi:hypothetical protein NY406_04310 [Chlorobaculum sp. MV4-Y]|uniref:hypothetical protein n=1 Tax=Chlorobaculum sp. MV4-Y TaxID=2976335 RepID=UPI0021AF6D4D|nr:hypothetical protein [Chlorobaculum sp. MV4-Y]UWX58494.1 hypothetical protein NY406_04310 [Chlorobaculum sp. MV4-Y]